MIEANTCTTQWQIGVGHEKIEIICKKLDQISQTLESNYTDIRKILDLKNDKIRYLIR